MADKIGTNEYGEILIYQTDNGQTNIEVKIEDDTVWLTQQQLTELYQCSKSNISEHIKHIFEEGELDKDSVVRKFRTTADDRKKFDDIICDKVDRELHHSLAGKSLDQLLDEHGVTDNEYIRQEKFMKYRNAAQDAARSFL